MINTIDKEYFNTAELNLDAPANAPNIPPAKLTAIMPAIIPSNWLPLRNTPASPAMLLTKMNKAETAATSLRFAQFKNKINVVIHECRAEECVNSSRESRVSIGANYNI